jgi:hypothetical protein
VLSLPVLLLERWASFLFGIVGEYELAGVGVAVSVCGESEMMPVYVML